MGAEAWFASGEQAPNVTAVTENRHGTKKSAHTNNRLRLLKKPKN